MTSSSLVLGATPLSSSLKSLRRQFRTLLFLNYTHWSIIFDNHNVSRWHYSLRDRLQPRHPRPRPRLRVRTVCQLRPRKRPRTRPRPSIQPRPMMRKPPGASMNGPDAISARRRRTPRRHSSSFSPVLAPSPMTPLPPHVRRRQPLETSRSLLSLAATMCQARATRIFFVWNYDQDGLPDFTGLFRPTVLYADIWLCV